ncbi:hypothetical protein M747DRAFT_293472 [Aspergillus niger ATCC 13496]|uniref:Uncharacterized protein n=1 Tax=Aspergillus niger ATCC 13496 TaxID=1353008 RepID=A0A370C779_ASPNG|nr:hypothetical protein M747DRAFT_293472 [Aspergillus niger ATCC 13496]
MTHCQGMYRTTLTWVSSFYSDPPSSCSAGPSGDDLVWFHPSEPLVTHGRIAAFADCGGAAQRRFTLEPSINDIQCLEMNTDN